MKKSAATSARKITRRDRELDFEIAFYEKLVREKPDFVDVLIPLAEACTWRGFYDRGLKHDLMLVKLRPDDPIVRYNLACSYTLTGRPEEAFSTLRKAIELGWDDLRRLERDQDLAPLRKDPRFGELAARLKELKRERRRML